MDIVNNVAQFPMPGETIHSKGTAFFPGGKGANQAVAAARSGSECLMLGAVGEDPFADTLLNSLHDNGIDTTLMFRKAGTSGFAIITVNGEGDNHIVLSPGANGQLTEADVTGAIADWSYVHAVLLQNEIPWETTQSVIQRASSNGVPVFYNPAPAREIPDALFHSIHTLILNETEAAVVSGVSVSDSGSALSAAERIIAKGTNAVILTLGEKGCVYRNANGESLTVPAFKMKAVDTTAAGDTFIGAYAAASAEGLAVKQAITFASAAAALAVTKAGAQASIPSKADIEAFIQSRSKPEIRNTRLKPRC